MQFEQQYDLDGLVRHGSGVRLSKAFFREQDLMAAISRIFDHAEVYHQAARALAAELGRLPKAEGAKVAARRLEQLLG
jgi:hypothetical protein